MNSSTSKVRENRARRMAARQGLELRKSRRRDELAIDFQTWRLHDAATGRVVAGGAFGTTLDEIEIELSRGRVRVLSAGRPQPRR